MFYTESHQRHENLHSNMVLLIRLSHITILYASSSFTFQYGSINTMIRITLKSHGLLFTFQYGSINTGLNVPAGVDKNDLHSNMVLLIQIDVNTQKGDITNLHYNMVLLILVFHKYLSGSIILPLSVDLVISYFFGAHNLLLWAIKSPVFP